MTQTQIIAEMARKYPDKKISQQFLSLILNGKRRPSWDTAKILGEVTGTSPSFWMEASPELMKRIVQDLAT